MTVAGWFRLNMVYWDNIEEPHPELDFKDEKTAHGFLKFLLGSKLVKAGTVYEIPPFGSEPADENPDYLLWFVKELERGPDHVRTTMDNRKKA